MKGCLSKHHPHPTTKQLAPLMSMLLRGPILFQICLPWAVFRRALLAFTYLTAVQHLLPPLHGRPIEVIAK